MRQNFEERTKKEEEQLLRERVNSFYKNKIKYLVKREN